MGFHRAIRGIVAYRCFEYVLFTVAGFFCNLLCSQIPIGLDEYKPNKLYNVVRVSSEDNIVTLGGYCKKVDTLGDEPSCSGFCQKVNPDYGKVQIVLKENEVLSIGDLRVIWQRGYLQPIPITINTIPVKIRAAFDGRPRLATTSFSNLGINLDVYRHRLRRYFADGKSSVHRSGFGVFLGPSIENIDADNVKVNLGQNEASRQLFISAGLTLTYAYNNISFILVPLGYDFATTSVGKKFRYDKKRWWGFGIGLRPQFFNGPRER